MDRERVRYMDKETGITDPQITGVHGNNSSFKGLDGSTKNQQLSTEQGDWDRDAQTTGVQ